MSPDSGYDGRNAQGSIAMRFMYAVFIVIAMAPLQGQSQIPVTARLPEGEGGLATIYPFDRGISEDPSVLFVESFEQDSLNALFESWEHVQQGDDMEFSSDVPLNSGGTQSLRMDRREGSGPQLYTRLKNRAGGWGVEQAFARFHVKFATDCGVIHHFGTHIGGFNPSTPWPQGGAGQRPDGNKRFTIGLEPYGSSWTWDAYVYWQGMHQHGDGNYWGTPFLTGVDKPVVKRGEWICVEIMARLNDVGAQNGELAFWIDGRLVRH